MKRIIFLMLFLVGMLTFSETLENINYSKGKMEAVLLEDSQVDIKAKVNTVNSRVELEIELPDVKVSPDIPRFLIVNDEYIERINIREDRSFTTLTIRLKPNVDSTIRSKVKGVEAEFILKNQKNAPAVQKIGPETAADSKRVSQTPQPNTQISQKKTTGNGKVKEIVIPRREVPKYQLQTIAPKNPNGKYTIVVDAGHGGHDPGARGSGYREKDIALSVAKRLVNNLSADYNVIMTRYDDYFVGLSERAYIGNRANADFFVSIHLNAGGSSATGTEVFYYEKNSAEHLKQIEDFENSTGGEYSNISSYDYFIQQENLYRENQEKSRAIARDVLNNLLMSFGLRDRGVKGANFAVLRGSNSPSILVELGFMSNYGDLSNFVTEYGQEQAARSIANSIRKFFTKK